MAFSYKRTITCGLATGADQASFPLLIKFDASNVGTDFKSVGNGGLLQNSVTQSGGNAVSMPADLILTSDSAGTTKIPWEIESWDAVNGTLWIWVKITSLTTATHATCYVFYDDAAVVAQQNTSTVSPSNVWDANFVGVYHLPNGTALTAADSTSNAFAGTLTNTPTAATGQVDGGASLLQASTQYIDVGNHAAMNPAAITLTVWVKATSFPNPYQAAVSRNATGDFAQILVKSSGLLALYVHAGGGIVSYDGTGSTTLSTGTWYQLTLAYDSVGGLKGYVNGAVDGSVTASGTLDTGTGANLALGYDLVNVGRGWNGIVDEARVSNVARSANWIATEFSNQNAPLSFNSIGTQTAVGGGGGGGGGALRGWRTIGGSGTPVGGGGSTPGAPADVTITSLVSQLLPPDANGNLLFGITATYTVPGGWTGTGVHGYFELPDQSGSTQFTLDGTTALGGTGALAGAWRPTPIGVQKYTAADPTHYFFFQVPAPSTAMTLRLRLVGMNTNADPAVTKTSPSATLSLGPPAVDLSGTKFAQPIVFTSLTVGTPAMGGNGILQTPLTVVYTEPADPLFGGVTFIVVWDNQALGTVSFSYNSGSPGTQTFYIPTPQAVNSFTVFAPSFDVNGSSNGIILGVTPSQPGFTGASGGTTTDGSVLNPSTVGIGVFVPTIRPVVNFVTPPTLPDPHYPPGTYGADLSGATPVLKRVNAAGTAWELGVNGGTDIQAGTVSATQIAANTITSSQIFANTITAAQMAAGAITASAIGSGTFPVGVIYASTIFVSQIGSGTLPVGVVYAGTILVSQIGSGTLPVGVIYGGTINCSQLNAGTINVAVTISAVNITGGKLTIAATNGGTGETKTITIDPASAGYTPLKVVSSLGSQASVDSLGFQIVNAGSGWTLKLDGLWFNLVKVIATTSTDPGAPSFSSVSDAQIWCTNLRNALHSAHHLF